MGAYYKKHAIDPLERMDIARAMVRQAGPGWPLATNPPFMVGTGRFGPRHLTGGSASLLRVLETITGQREHREAAEVIGNNALNVHLAARMALHSHPGIENDISRGDWDTVYRVLLRTNAMLHTHVALTTHDLDIHRDSEERFARGETTWGSMRRMRTALLWGEALGQYTQTQPGRWTWGGEIVSRCAFAEWFVEAMRWLSKEMYRSLGVPLAVLAEHCLKCLRVSPVRFHRALEWLKPWDFGPYTKLCGGTPDVSKTRVFRSYHGAVCLDEFMPGRLEYQEYYPDGSARSVVVDCIAEKVTPDA